MDAKSHAPISLFNNYMNIGSNADNKIRAVFTADQLADYLAISKATVYRLVGKRQLPFRRVGGQLRFRREDIEKYLETGRIEPIKL